MQSWAVERACKARVNRLLKEVGGSVFREASCLNRLL